MNLYLDSGYLNVKYLRETAPAFTFCTGGRGVGKTYGFLKSYRLTDPAPFIFLRRTQEQIDMCMQEPFSPFKSIDVDNGIYTVAKKYGKRIVGFYNGVKNGDEIITEGPPLAYGMALSTIHNIRGFDASSIKAIIYDEFIPESHERLIKNEYEALMNAYETINRNRELKGEPPVKMFCCSNSNTLANPYFIGLGVVRAVDSMIAKEIEIKEYPNRQLRLIHLLHSPISEQKSTTALYTLTNGTQFADMALNNTYANESRSKTGNIPLKELIPLAAIGELCLYRHKSNARKLYGSTHISGAPIIYKTSDADIARFKAAFGWTWELYLTDNIVWQDYLPEILYRNFMGSKW